MELAAQHAVAVHAPVQVPHVAQVTVHGALPRKELREELLRKRSRGVTHAGCGAGVGRGALTSLARFKKRTKGTGMAPRKMTKPQIFNTRAASCGEQWHVRVPHCLAAAANTHHAQIWRQGACGDIAFLRGHHDTHARRRAQRADSLLFVPCVPQLVGAHGTVRVKGRHAGQPAVKGRVVPLVAATWAFRREQGRV